MLLLKGHTIAQLRDLSKPKLKYIYGPVNSWRFGKSLGIDLLSSERKLCNFDCIYCQLGKGEYLTKRGFYVKDEDVVNELMSIPPLKVDYITFSGMGEPTLAGNLGSCIKKVKSLKIAPISVLTNATLLKDDDLCNELSDADIVSCKLDAPSSSLFKKINRPKDVEFSDIISSIINFKKGYKGKCGLQIMFLSENKDLSSRMREICEKIIPDFIHINTPTRYCQEMALSPDEIFKIKGLFKGFNVLSCYDKEKVSIVPLNKEATLKRRKDL